ncbi:hypothetical protein LG3211_1174 [Lysobacter gummosus]|nr:hypothetical protein LG3211_1174 [Lysobacter gummosus]
MKRWLGRPAWAGRANPPCPPLFKGGNASCRNVGAANPSLRQPRATASRIEPTYRVPPFEKGGPGGIRSSLLAPSLSPSFQPLPH